MYKLDNTTTFVKYVEWVDGAARELMKIDAASGIAGRALYSVPNLSFEDAFELAQCLTGHVDCEAALDAFSARRVPRAQTVHARNVLISDKAHSADAHDFMKGVLERAKLNEAEFQEYLHGYKPAAGWSL